MQRVMLASVVGITLVVGTAVAFAVADQKLVLVTVVADESKPAIALAPAAFSISEGKDKLEVVEAVPAKDPLSVVLVVDTALPEGLNASTPEVRAALASFVSTLHAGEPQAEIALYHVAQGARELNGFTSDRATLEKNIGVIAPGSPGDSAMLEGVVTATRVLAGRPAPRRAIVCVSMGTLEGSNLRPEAVTSQVRKSGATLWVVSVQRSNDVSLTSRDMVWTKATTESGGLRQNMNQPSRLAPQLKAVANSLLSQYTLKIARQKDGEVKEFKGQTTNGAPVLFTRWMR